MGHQGQDLALTTAVVTALMLEQFDAGADTRTRQALQTLLHPELLGTTFQLLALASNFDC